MDIAMAWAQREAKRQEYCATQDEITQLWKNTMRQSQPSDGFAPTLFELQKKCNKIIAEADEVYLQAVQDMYGNSVTAHWVNWHDDLSSYECHLSNGIMFIPGQTEPVELMR